MTTTYRILRGPERKPVSGLFADKREAIAKAEDLSSARPFSYAVVEGPNVNVYDRTEAPADV